VPPGGATRSIAGLTWSYPSRAQCFACHSAAAQFSLGLETRQLNIDAFYPSTGRTANRQYTLDYIGMLSGNKAALFAAAAGSELRTPSAARSALLTTRSRGEGRALPMACLAASFAGLSFVKNRRGRGPSPSEW
jgi:hypothetical protein